MSSTVRLTVRYNSWKTLEDEVKRRMQLPQDDPERMLRPVGLHVMAHGAGTLRSKERRLERSARCAPQRDAARRTPDTRMLYTRMSPCAD